MKNLRNLRIDFGYSQQQLADMLGVTQQSINKYEHGLAEPGISMLIRMSKIFNTSIDYIVGNDSID